MKKHTLITIACLAIATSSAYADITTGLTAYYPFEGSVADLSGNGYNGTKEARKDWLRFLRDLETRYYDSMVAHLRTNCGYGGLIFGTIMANSPATVQSRLDVIDGHASSGNIHNSPAHRGIRSTGSSPTSRWLTRWATTTRSRDWRDSASKANPS